MMHFHHHLTIKVIDAVQSHRISISLTPKINSITECFGEYNCRQEQAQETDTGSHWCSRMSDKFPPRLQMV